MTEPAPKRPPWTGSTTDESSAHLGEIYAADTDSRAGWVLARAEASAYDDPGAW